MFVELIYDKRNFEGLAGAKEIILTELTKRVHRIFPDASKHEKEQISRAVQEMFEEADMWMQED